MLYLLLKVLHIVAIICWMAGILYLLRLFVYHSEYGPKSEDNHKLLTLMERRLLYYITHPAMTISWLAGIGMLVVQPAVLAGGWFHAKLTMVLILTAFTVWSGTIRRKLSERVPVYSPRTLRVFNELPTLLMVVIVYLVVLRPF